jgi:hypothetical protein
MPILVPLFPNGIGVMRVPCVSTFIVSTDSYIPPLPVLDVSSPLCRPAVVDVAVCFILSEISI